MQGHFTSMTFQSSEMLIFISARSFYIGRIKFQSSELLIFRRAVDLRQPNKIAKQ